MRGTLSALLLVAGVSVACQSGDAPADESTAAPAETAAAPAPPAGPVVFMASDFSFQGPASIEGGPRQVRLMNHGTELHHIQFVRIDEGHTVDELMAAYAEGNYHPSFAHDVGGPNLVPPGSDFSSMVDFRPGTYAVLCLIPSPDMTLHVEKGMMMTMEVTAPAVPAAMPEADVTLTMRDYGFDFSAPITAGTHTIRIETDAPQSHEFVVFRLPEGGAANDILAWVDGGQQGPPPFTPVGGVTAMATGEVNQLTLDFEPGTYAFICFVPDLGDGAPHFVHGMVQEYVVS